MIRQQICSEGFRSLDVESNRASNSFSGVTIAFNATILTTNPNFTSNDPK